MNSPPCGHLERHLRRRQRLLGANDALRNRRLGHQKRASDLVGRQAAQKAQRQRGPCVDRQQRMAADEHQPEQVVADEVVGRGIHVGGCQLLVDQGVLAQLLLLALPGGSPAQLVDGAVLGGRHQPGTRLRRHAFGRPLAQRRLERVLRQIFGQVHVAHHARQPGDQPGRLDAPDRLDGARASSTVTRRCAASWPPQCSATGPSPGSQMRWMMPVPSTRSVARSASTARSPLPWSRP